MKRYTKFGVLWLINALLLLLAYDFVPSAYALGSNVFTPLMAALFTGFVWNVILWYVEPAFKDLEIDTKGSAKEILAYLTVNFVTLWFLARFAFITGFGVSSFLYVFALALVANFVQHVAWQWMDKK